ncbi:hypothetical protein [Magnetospirillum molischianum]|uniref:EAL domain-containing protein n=1 Tax=Magnetospirillum molischianum DSM 120 TaxID=1150626 RepID=H8FMJ0_MAGML|nr:hypothetical protein [Magnetospirillum molischianum]CCG39578.1 conserved hypothetical protein [Magnetospirillum molischianum DSM 120]
MNAGAFGGKPQEVVTPESLLFDAAERVGRLREGRQALHLHLSRLLPANREEGRIRIAFRMFESMVSVYRGQIFLLSNSDIMLICKDAQIPDLDAIVYKLRALFSTDPLTYAESADGTDRFVALYDLECDYEAFFSLCGEMVAEVRKTKIDMAPTPKRLPLEATTLVRVLDGIGNTDIAGVVRRQACIRIVGHTAAEVEFQEFYMSIADLQKVLAPDIDILCNRWLFQHLSQELDQQVLATLGDAGFQVLPRAFSLNLNVSTIETPAFRKFEAAVRGKAGLLVEFQMLDVFNNLDGFFHARDRLRTRGHKTVLDGMTSVGLQFMDCELFDTDYVKLSWSQDMLDDIRTAEIQHALAPVGFDRVILSRCETETAISWGLSIGIRMFQGRFLDSMTAAATMGVCDKAAACSLAQCTSRHGIITGTIRTECGNADMLDLFPPLRALQ